MKGFSIEKLMRRISIIPGFSFLERWVTEFDATRTKMNQRVGDLKAYRDAASAGMGDVAGAVRGGGDGSAAADPSSELGVEQRERDYGYDDDHDDDYEEEDYTWDDY